MRGGGEADYALCVGQEPRESGGAHGPSGPRGSGSGALGGGVERQPPRQSDKLAWARRRAGRSREAQTERGDSRLRG